MKRLYYATLGGAIKSPDLKLDFDWNFRTFPHHEYFTDGQGIGQENLFNVLKAYSLYDPEVGYCQGLPFVVAILLLNVSALFSEIVRG